MRQETITKDQPLQHWQDYVVPQCWEAFTAEDHAVWDLLFARQVELLGSRVISPFLDGIDLLRLSHPGVPDVEGLNAILGWCRTRFSSPC
jgi:phenylalanine-4-hydroxylase